MKRTTIKAKKTLTQRQRNYLKAKLLEKRRELLAKLDAEMRSSLPASGVSPGDDLLDQAQDFGEQETSFQIAEIDSRAVEQINDAIHRLESGSYGICEACEEPIPPARLQAMPSATLCIKCKSDLERQGVQASRVRYGRIRDVEDESFDPERLYGTTRGHKLS